MSPKRNGLPTFREIVDRLTRLERRPLSGGGSPGVTDHGALTGLGDDDHPQYGLRSVLTALSGVVGSLSGTVDAIVAVVFGEPKGGSPNGLMFICHSYGADMLNPNGHRIPAPPAFGSTTGGNEQRHWPQMLRRRHGLRENVYHWIVRGAGSNAGGELIGLFAPDFFGSIRSVYFSPFSNVIGGTANSRNLYLANSSVPFVYFARLRLLNGVDLVSGSAGINNIPRTFDVGTQLLTKDRLIYWLSEKVGTAGLGDGDGGDVIGTINGGPYTNYGCVGSALASSNPDSGGHGEINQHMSFRALAGGATATAVVINETGKIDPSLNRSGLAIFCHGLNDLNILFDQAQWQESLRFVLCAIRWNVRYLWMDASQTEVAGNGGGAFGTRTGTPVIGYRGQLRYFTGAPGTTTPTSWSYAVPANYNGEPIDLLFYSEPARTEAITVTTFNPGFGTAILSAPIPNFNADDVGRPIAWAGSPLDMTVTDSTHINAPTGTVTLGAKSALIGRGGGIGTITIDGAAPDFAGGVRINGGTSAVVDTDQVTPALPVSAFAPGAVENVYAIPIVKRIEGPAPGAHTIKLTVDSMAVGPSRFYRDGWAREAPEVPYLWIDTPVTPAKTAPQVADTITFNGWSEEILAEFPNRYSVPMFDEFSPGGVPDESLFDDDNTHPSYSGSAKLADLVDGVIQTIPTRLLMET